MRYLLTPFGSSGDVFPYLAIGRELRRRGNDVTVVAAEPFRAAVERVGLSFASGGSSDHYDAITHHPDLWHPRRGMRLVLQLISDALRDHYATLSDLYEPGRTVLVGHPLAFVTRIFEEKHRAPAATIHIAPSIFRSEYVAPVFEPGYDLSRAPRWYKRGTYWIADRFFLDPHINPSLNAFRAELNLPAVGRVFHSWIHSPRLTIGIFPDWFGPPQPDWPPPTRLTGFILYDDDQTQNIDPEIEDFLVAGEPPIVFTPGTGNRQAPGFFETAVKAVDLLGMRALLLTGYPEQLPAQLPPTVRHASYLPFSSVLPRSAAVVHHGGVGTCAQGLAAGIPQLTMPMGFDQPDNATRLRRLGVGTWLTPRKFTPSRLASALETLLESSETADACQKYRRMVRESDALQETCSLLEELGS
jgi:UDP:flavonoid glycosyltransferase YjiC (YdhE family)